MRYDFSGWATRNDLKCSDGRVIRRNAFKDNDGQTVPLVWNHDHNDPSNVLGHALLENRDNGVYAYGVFNDTEAGQNAKMLVENGDINHLSIYANKLQQQGPNVLHGAIREVSLVLAGANPGAYIESVMVHSDGADEEAIIYTGEELELYHSDGKGEGQMDNEKTVQEVFDELTEEQKNVVYALIGQVLEEAGVAQHSDDDDYYLEHADDEDYEDDYDDADYDDDYDDEDGETIQDVFDGLTDQQKEVVYTMIGHAVEDAEDYEGDDEDMKHNVFDQEETMYGDALSHSEMQSIIDDGKRFGSMKESFLAHAQDYGIESIDWLFPDAKTLTNTPEFIKRDMGWVTKVMGAVKRTPFSRIKSMFADITADEARAKGYLKGNKKKEEVFSLLKRTTTPTTIYKKQKMDRDDVVDITDFDVIAWLKGEMRMMLDEEIARAILVGDGRLSSSDEKINEQNIRPVLSDDDLYTIKSKVAVAAGATGADKAKAFIDQVIRSRKDYKGSGNPTLFTTEDLVTECLLLEDKIGHKLYKTEAELATAMRVKEIVTVEVMEGLKDKDNKEVAGIVVNLVDYNVGADKGGAINMFDDFDIDYNQQKYLIETRCSGALTKPYSAIALSFDEAAAA